MATGYVEGAGGWDRAIPDTAPQPSASAPGKVQADPSRISEMLRALGEIGADPAGGVSRLAFTAAEREAHALVRAWLQEMGLSVRQDPAGNMVAERPGTLASAPAIGVGSHLDSVPHGGRFDGAAGVVGAVELVRLLSESGAQMQHPVRIVAFAAEEGARFGEPSIGSKAVVGLLEGRDLHRIQDPDGVTLAAAMTSVGVDPTKVLSAKWDPHDWAAFLELHVEQGRVLEAEGRQIGLVDVVSGSTRLRAVLRGRASHSGGTPMTMRSDALSATAEVILATEALAKDPRHRGTRATVGRLEVYPNSITTIPGSVMFTVDIRDVDSDRQRQTAAEIVRRARQICERRGIRLEVEVMTDTSPAVLPMWLREITSASCRHLGVGPRAVNSGAGHDAQIVNRLVPAAMILVPSKDGLSHVPEEWSSASDIAKGVEVLYRSVLRLDGFLAELQGLGSSQAPGAGPQRASSADPSPSQ